MDILSEKMVNIRKNHLCHGCQHWFHPKAEMTRQVIADGGKVWSVYYCLSCEKLRDYYDDFDGLPEGFTREMMADDHFKGRPDQYLEYCKLNYKTIKDIEHELSCIDLKRD